MSAAGHRWWQRATRKQHADMERDLRARIAEIERGHIADGMPGEVVYSPPPAGHECRHSFPRDARVGTIWRCGACSAAWRKASEWGWEPLTDDQLRRALRRALVGRGPRRRP